MIFFFEKLYFYTILNSMKLTGVVWALFIHLFSKNVMNLTQYGFIRVFSHSYNFIILN